MKLIFFKIRLYLICALLVFLGSVQFLAAEDSYPDGVEILQRKYEIFSSKVTVSITKIDLDKAKVVIITPQSLSKNNKSKYMGLTLREYAKLGNFKFLHSGGYLSSFSPPFPLGYVKIDGKEYNRVHNTWLTKGIFCSNGNDILIESYSDETQFGSWNDCIQAGPILLKNSKIVMDQDNRSWNVRNAPATQSFICKDENDNLLLGITTPTTLEKLVPSLLKSQKDGGLGCVDATALTGAKTAGMIYGDKQFGNLNLSMPTAIAVIPNE